VADTTTTDNNVPEYDGKPKRIKPRHKTTFESIIFGVTPNTKDKNWNRSDSVATEFETPRIPVTVIEKQHALFPESIKEFVNTPFPSHYTSTKH
jgi:hypothetical protein